MAKRKDSSEPTQLTLDLTLGPVGSVCAGVVVSRGTTGRHNNVTVFVDSATLAVRREAVERVARSGIFAISQGRQHLVKG